jgi:hypothetical protein
MRSLCQRSLFTMRVRLSLSLFALVSFFCSLFFSLLLDHDLVVLMRGRGKVEDADKLMFGELRMLDLISCQLGDFEARVLAAFIKVDETVQRVYLNWNAIGPLGVEAIADAFKHNKTVWFLDLYSNPIGQESEDVFIDALSRNACLTVFGLWGNNISPKSITKIEFLTKTRNAVLIPAAVRRASLYLIAARRTISDAGILAIFPKEIVKMISMAVWATRKDPEWIEAVSDEGQPHD